jgi:hypothetical protein
MRTRASGRSLSEPFQVLCVQSKAYRNARKDFPLKPWLLYIFVALLSLATSPPLRAQGPGPSADSGIAGDDPSGTHSVSGVLLDPSGAAVVKAQVTLLGTRTEVVAQTQTDAVGAFHFDNVAPGKYTIDFYAEGFRDARMPVAVSAKRFSPLRVVLQILVQTENVTVATGVNVPVVSTETSENQNNNAIDREALDRVPVFDQDYITTMSRFLDDSATGTNGVTLVVNGIEANGPGVTPSAVQEVKINNNPYSARFASGPGSSGDHHQGRVSRLSWLAEFHVSRLGV